MYTFQFSVLGSGSKGNATYYEPHGDGDGLMIDIGFPDKRIKSGLAGINRSFHDNVHDVLITHDHGDHLPKNKAHLHTMETAFEDMCSVQSNCYAPSSNSLITRFPLIHDIPCYGFLIEADGTRVAHITDTGDIYCDTFGHLVGLHALVVEANWDEVLIDDMISENKVPLSRIEHSMDDHFSNQQMADLVEAVAWPGLEYVILIHLSDSNNAPELAMQAAEHALGDHFIGNGGGCRVIVSRQDRATPLIILKGE